MENFYKGLYKQSYEKGFTLIEILVAIAIAGIVMAGIYSAYYSQQKSYVVQEQVAIAQQNLRAAMYFMEREVRMVGCDPMGSANAAIITAGADTFQFSEDIGDGAGGNPNGTIDAGENITYALNGTNLTRTAGGGAQTIAENIQTLNFRYFDADNIEITQPVTATTIVNIRSVQISMTAGTGTNQRDLSAHVKCRNLGLEDT